MSELERVIMSTLSSHGELCGSDIAKLSNGAVSRGSVYTTLARMERKGMLTSRQEDKRPCAIGLPRRLFKPLPWVRMIEVGGVFFHPSCVPPVLRAQP